MKTRFQRLALTAMLLSGTSITFADEPSGSAVGDLPGYGEEAYFHKDAAYGVSEPVRKSKVTPVSGARSIMAAPTASTAGYRSPKPPAATRQAAPRQAAQRQTTQRQSVQRRAAQRPLLRTAQYSPVGANELQPAGFFSGSSFDSSCDGSCDGGCDSACGKSKRRKICGIFDRCGLEGWATTEALAWFVQDRESPALVTQSNPGTLPVLPNGGTDNVRTVFGNAIEGELSAGIRADYGIYLNDQIGIGGRFWILGTNNDSFFATSDGSDATLGRPFFNTTTGSEDALLAGFDGTFTGSVAADSSLDIWAAEAYARLKFSCTKTSQLDFLLGYSHFQVRDRLQISSTTITDATARTRDFRDLFKGENRFDGGQFGFEMVMRRGRWTARSLTKVHVGNMNQSMLIAGYSSDQTAPAAPSVTSGGMLALGNQGYRERNVFSFIPEANFKLSYTIHHNVSLSAGYTFLYFDKVALAGETIDRNIDPSAFNTGVFGTSPAFNFNDASLWVQGLDLGLIIEI